MLDLRIQRVHVLARRLQRFGLAICDGKLILAAQRFLKKAVLAAHAFRCQQVGAAHALGGNLVLALHAFHFALLLALGCQRAHAVIELAGLVGLAVRLSVEVG